LCIKERPLNHHKGRLVFQKLNTFCAFLQSENVFPLTGDFVARKAAFDSTIVEIRRFYKDFTGKSAPGIPGFYLRRPEWEILKGNRNDLEAAVKTKRFKRVALHNNKVVEVSQGRVWLKRDFTNRESDFIKRCYIGLPAGCWEALFTACETLFPGA